MRRRIHQLRHATALAAIAAIAAAACTTPGGGGGAPGGASGIVQTPYAVACDGGMDHSGGGMDHGGGGMPGMHGPARLNHDPCDAQKAAARKLVADTRAAVARKGQNTLAGLLAQGFFSIGDEITGTTHYTKNSLRNDNHNMEPDYVEEFAVRGGRVVAAMYVLGVGMTMNNVPDIAGNWTMWHDHVLSWQSNNPNARGYYRLGGAFVRQEPPMLHVWLQKNACGPFAGTDAGGMSGSCVKGIE